MGEETKELFEVNGRDTSSSNLEKRGIKLSNDSERYQVEARLCLNWAGEALVYRVRGGKPL